MAAERADPVDGEAEAMDVRAGMEDDDNQRQDEAAPTVSPTMPFEPVHVQADALRNTAKQPRPSLVGCPLCDRLAERSVHLATLSIRVLIVWP